MSCHFAPFSHPQIVQPICGTRQQLQTLITAADQMTDTHTHSVVPQIIPGLASIPQPCLWPDHMHPEMSIIYTLEQNDETTNTVFPKPGVRRACGGHFQRPKSMLCSTYKLPFENEFFVGIPTRYAFQRDTPTHLDKLRHKSKIHRPNPSMWLSLTCPRYSLSSSNTIFPIPEREFSLKVPMYIAFESTITPSPC